MAWIYPLHTSFGVLWAGIALFWVMSISSISLITPLTFVGTFQFNVYWLHDSVSLPLNKPIMSLYFSLTLWDRLFNMSDLLLPISSRTRQKDDCVQPSATAAVFCRGTLKSIFRELAGGGLVFFIFTFTWNSHCRLCCKFSLLTRRRLMPFSTYFAHDVCPTYFGNTYVEALYRG